MLALASEEKRVGLWGSYLASNRDRIRRLKTKLHQIFPSLLRIRKSPTHTHTIQTHTHSHTNKNTNTFHPSPIPHPLKIIANNRTQYAKKKHEFRRPAKPPRSSPHLNAAGTPKFSLSPRLWFDGECINQTACQLGTV